ncbi:MAG: Ldh family oxidoreductase [Rhodomicrobiaceae bacterium]
MSGTKHTSAELIDLIGRALTASGTSADNAAAVARALVAAEIDGQKGHGLSRVAAYAAQARSGKVDGRAVPNLQRTRAASVMIDVAHGFAYPAFELATAELPKIARETGIAAAGFTRSHHAGALGLVVERIALTGMLGLMVSNSPHAIAAWAGRRGLFGTNPIALAAPRPGRDPLIIDLALSEVARGKIMTAAQKGEPIPDGWAKDADGNPTTDAAAALKGTLIPIGGAKGAALALMVEILSAALTGANLAFQASSFFDAEGVPPGIGQFLMVIDPAAFGGDAFAERIGQLAQSIEADGARLPGTRRHALREAAVRDGVLVEDQLLQQIGRIAEPGASKPQSGA